MFTDESNSAILENNQGYKLKTQFVDAENLLCQLSDKWALPVQNKAVIFVINDIEVVLKRLRLSKDELLQKKSFANFFFRYIEYMRRNKLPQSRAYGFQIESQDSRSTVITLGKYGLSGGGKTGAYISSAAMTTTGLVMVFFGVASGAALVNAGISGGIYTYKTECYSNKDYAKELGISVVSSSASGGLSWLGSGVALIDSGTKILVSTCSNAVGGCTRVITRHLFSGELPSIKEVGKSALGGAAGSLASASVDSLMGAFAGESTDLLSAVMKKSVTEGASNAANTATETIVINKLDGKKWDDDDLVLSAVFSGVSGAAIGGINGVNEFRSRVGESTNNQFQQDSTGSTQKNSDISKSNFQKQESLRHKNTKLSFNNIWRNKIGSLEKRGAIFKVHRRLVDANTALKYLLKGDKVKYHIKENHKYGHLKISSKPKLEDTKGSSKQAHSSIPNSGDTSGIDGRVKDGRVVVGWRKSQLTINRDASSSITYLTTELMQDISKVSGQGGFRYFDADWDTLAEHIVLVHAINPEAIGGNLPPEEVAEFSEKDDLGKCEWSLKRVLTPYAEMGHHLQFENIQYKNALIDRPHIHWSANQLVQPHSRGNWEASKIAILEPLSAIEKSADMRVFGVAPYDILTIGSHILSANAVIIVPSGVERFVRLYLTNFQGRIVTYDENDESLTLRKIISKNIAAIYPDVWNIVTETGTRIDIVESLTSAGYQEQTCLKTNDGRILRLISGEGRTENQQLSLAMKQASASKRFIGLHFNSKTYILEDNKHGYFAALKTFKKNLISIRHNSFFAGRVDTSTIESMRKFGILAALEFYQGMMEFDSNTRAHDVANYIFNEAIFADISSIYYLKHPTTDFEFSSYELHLMIESGKSHLLEILIELKVLLNSSEVDIIAVKEIYNNYCAELERIVSCCLTSRSQMASDLAQVQSDDKTELPPIVGHLLADVRAAEIWRQIVESNIERVDVFREWPLNEIQRQYLLEVMRILPTEVNLLVKLYRGIDRHAASSDLADKFDKLRLKFISEAIKILLYCQHYCLLYQSQQCNVQELSSNKKLPAIFKQNNNFIIAYPIAPRQISLEEELAAGIMSASSATDIASHDNIGRTAQQKRRLDDAEKLESDSKRQDADADADADIDEVCLDTPSDRTPPASESEGDFVDQGGRKRRPDLPVAERKRQMKGFSVKHSVRFMLMRDELPHSDTIRSLNESFGLADLQCSLQNSALRVEERELHAIINGEKIYFDEVAVEGNGWCTLNAIGIREPSVTLNTLKMSLDNPIIVNYLRCAIENNYHSSLAHGEAFMDDEIGGVNDLWNNIKDNLQMLYQLCQDATSEDAEQKYLEMTRYLERRDVQEAYINYLLKSKYVDINIALACLTLQGGPVGVALFIDYNKPDGKLVNYFADSITTIDDNIVCLVLRPNQSQHLAHYNVLKRRVVDNVVQRSLMPRF